MRPRNLQITGWLVTLAIIAVSVMISRSGLSDREADDRTATTPLRKRVERVSLVSKSQLNEKDVLRMTPGQWTARFETRPHEVTPEIRDEIVFLAWELGRELQAGIDPLGDDAGAYTDSILTLLTAGAPETAR